MNLWDLISAVIGNIQINTKGLGRWINGHVNSKYSLHILISLFILFGGVYIILGTSLFDDNRIYWFSGHVVLWISIYFVFSSKHAKNLERIRAIENGNQIIEQMCSDPTTIKIQTSILSDTIHPKKRVELVVQKEQEGHVATLSVGDNIVRQVLLDKT